MGSARTPFEPENLDLNLHFVSYVHKVDTLAVQRQIERGNGTLHVDHGRLNLRENFDGESMFQDPTRERLRNLSPLTWPHLSRDGRP